MALKKSYHTTNDAFLKIAELQKLHDGSTGITSLIRNNKLLVGNVGDCRALLLSNGKSIQMSIDQKPTNPEEMKRISSLGGIITNNLGVARVNGVLAVSRAFGNRKLRKVIRPDIEMMQRELTRDDDYLIMASDGLWDVLKNRDVCDTCYSLASSSYNTQQIAEELVNNALIRGSMDNVTCIVVKLNGYVIKLKMGKEIDKDINFRNGIIGTSMDRNSMKVQGGNSSTPLMSQTLSNLVSSPSVSHNSEMEGTQGQVIVIDSRQQQLLQQQQQAKYQQSRQQHTTQYQSQLQQTLIHHQQQQQQQQQQQVNMQRSLFPRGHKTQIPPPDNLDTDDVRHSNLHHNRHSDGSKAGQTLLNNNDNNNSYVNSIINDKHNTSHTNTTISNTPLNEKGNNVGSNVATNVTSNRSELPLNVNMNNNNNYNNSNINANIHLSSKSARGGISRTKYGSMGDLLKNQDGSSVWGNNNYPGGAYNCPTGDSADLTRNNSNNLNSNNNINNNVVTRPWSVSAMRTQMVNEIQSQPQNSLPTSVTTSSPTINSTQQPRQILTSQSTPKLIDRAQQQQQQQQQQLIRHDDILLSESQSNQNPKHSTDHNRQIHRQNQIQNQVQGRGTEVKELENGNTNIRMRMDNGKDKTRTDNTRAVLVRPFPQPAKGLSKTLPIMITNQTDRSFVNVPNHDPKSGGFLSPKDVHNGVENVSQGSVTMSRRTSECRAVSASAASVRHHQNQNQNINNNSSTNPNTYTITNSNSSSNSSANGIFPKAVSTESLNMMHHSRESRESPFSSSPDKVFSSINGTNGMGGQGSTGARPLHSPIAFLSTGAGTGTGGGRSVGGVNRQRNSSVTLRNMGAHRQTSGQSQGQNQGQSRGLDSNIDHYNSTPATGLNGERQRVPSTASDRRVTQMRIAYA